MGIGTGNGLTLTDELDELIDVVITSPTNGQSLVFNAPNNRWVNASAAGGGGGVSSVSAGGGLMASTNPITDTGDISIADTAVSAGAYIYASITVNSKGQITDASNGVNPVTSVAVSGKNGINVAGSPITSTGTIDIGLGDITPTSVTTGVVSASTVNVTEDIQAATGRITASAATISALLNGAAASFSGIVSANAGVVGTTASFSGAVSANGGLSSTTGNFSGTLTGAAATFSGIVSANSGIRSTTGGFSALVSADGGINTTVVSGVSINVTGDVRAVTGRVLASSATFTDLLTGNTAAFSGIVSANGGLAAAALTATTGNFSSTLTGAAATFSGIVSANAGLRSTTLTATTGRFSGLVSADAGVNTTAVSAATGRFSSTITASNLSGTNTGDQTITLSNDVSGSGTGAISATFDLDKTHGWKGQQYFGIATLTDASAVAWNASTQQVAQLTITGVGRVLQNPTNMQSGATYILHVISGTTSAALTYGTAYRWPSSAAPVITPASGAVSILTFCCRASSMYGVANINFL